MSSTQLTNKEAAKLKKTASVLSVSLSSFLAIIKLIATALTGSLVILTSLIDSLGDVLASTVTFIAIRFSTKPASCDFRYGYGKAEALSSFLQGLFISASGVYIMFDGIMRLFDPREIDDSIFGIAVMLTSLTLTFLLIKFQQYVMKRTESLAIKGDHAHYIVDIATNLSIIATLVLIRYTKLYWIDSVIAVSIAIYFIIIAIELIKDAIFVLMDQELSPEIRNNVQDIILSQKYTKGVHDLRTRSLGGSFIFEFHLELDPEISLHEAHELSHKLEDEIVAIYPNSQVVIHQEPKGAVEYQLDNDLHRCNR